MSDSAINFIRTDTQQLVPIKAVDLGDGSFGLATSGRGSGPAFTYATLLSEALSFSDAQIFRNAPANTKEIWLTLRNGGVTLRTDNGTPTAGANGHDFAGDTGAPWVFTDISQAAALLVKAIQNGGTTTGWVAYRG